MLSLATSHIAHYCNQLNHVVLPISMPRFKSIICYYNNPKINLFLQKNAKFSSAGGSAPRPPCLRRLGALLPDPQPPAAGGFAHRPPLAFGGYCEILATRLPEILRKNYSKT